MRNTEVRQENSRLADEFDAKWYLDTYPDVRLLGMDPFEHYLWLGTRLGRKMSANAAPGTAFPSVEFRLGAEIFGFCIQAEEDEFWLF